MELGLWTGFCLLHGQHPLEDAFSILHRCDWKVCELDERNAYSWFVAAKCLDDSITRYRNLSGDVKTTQMHAPYPLSDITAQIKVIETLAKVSEAIGAHVIVIHPYRGAAAIPDGLSLQAYRDQLIRQTISMLSSATQIASRYGIAIALENQIDLEFDCGRYVGTLPADLERLLDSVNDLGLAIDTAHACAQQLDVSELIRWASSRLYGLHVSDSDGLKHDYHIMPTRGIIDWHKVLLALRDIGYKGDFHLEIVHERHQCLPDSLAKAREAKSIMDNLMKEASLK